MNYTILFSGKGTIFIVLPANTPFYLTGGTLLGRYYYGHRYSDDLDYFVNNDDDYQKYVRAIIKELKKQESVLLFTVDNEAILAEKDYTQLVVTKRMDEDTFDLRIDLINDVAARDGEIETDEKFGRIDNVLNILSNKLTAMYRLEPKDIADVLIISKNVEFDWKVIVLSAKEKEMGLDVLKISEIIKTFPIDYIDKIKWSMPVDKKRFLDEVSVISEDLFWSRKNTLPSTY
ncbi:MAG: nucleotidyl transferase AbiEii/AbiGii toxin family protein [Deltaproteobacteria bacterium]|nr:nucleotidyl transferase AbiEii/AbiGii toxin family protein [Deltaproteobacteria bacterium]